MMINPGPSDSSAVFALLTAISNPEAAKASLQEIMDAHAAYQITIEDFREESKKTSEELNTKAADAEAKLAEATKIKNDFDSSYDKKSKKLDALQDDLQNRTSILASIEISQKKLSDELDSRERTVSDRESAVLSREDANIKLSQATQALKADYESKLSALKAIL